MMGDDAEQLKARLTLTIFPPPPAKAAAAAPPAPQALPPVTSGAPAGVVVSSLPLQPATAAQALPSQRRVQALRLRYRSTGLLSVAVAVSLRARNHVGGARP